MKNCKFSIIVAAHKRPKLLSRCLQSIQSQTFKDFEVIVVMDSVDALSFEIVGQFIRNEDIFIKHNGEPGPASSRNLALDAANGEWIVFLDDDDQFTSTHLNTLNTAILNNPNKKIFYCDARVVVEDRSVEIPVLLEKQRSQFSNIDIDDIWIKNFIPNNCLAFKKEHLKNIYFDTNLNSLEDWEFLLAACYNTSPLFYQGDGPIVHKDFKNKGNRRGTTQEAQGSALLLDYLYIYKKRPAPSLELKQKRCSLLRLNGFDIEPQFL